MNIWIISRECAEIAEAGGVKNVTFSLCKDFQELKQNVTLFIPIYKCTNFDFIKNLSEEKNETEIEINNKKVPVKYVTGTFKNGNFSIVFIKNDSFSEKEGIYTYTNNEQKINPEHQKGKGHEDALFLDILFQKAVIAYGNFIQNEQIPDVIHCQDASTACLPALIKENPVYNKIFSKTKTVVTIHNAGPAYHHNFKDIEEARLLTELSTETLKHAENNGKIEPFLLADDAGSYLTTVSEKYAEEITDPEKDNETENLASIFAKRKTVITGITNGIDYYRYTPKDTSISMLPYPYNPETGDLKGKELCQNYFLNELNNFDSNKDFFAGLTKYGSIETKKDEKPIYIAYHGRIASQKGITLLIDAIPVILNNFPEVRFIIAGQGESEIENELIRISSKNKGKVVYLNGYNKSAVRLATASCDFAVLPSFFEPCGLEDFIAQIYGTLPVAHSTGGLTKIVNYKNGFLYTNNTTESLIAKLSEVISIKKYNPAIINNMIITAANDVHSNYYWKNVIETKYIPFFEKIINE